MATALLLARVRQSAWRRALPPQVIMYVDEVAADRLADLGVDLPGRSGRGHRARGLVPQLVRIVGHLGWPFPSTSSVPTAAVRPRAHLTRPSSGFTPPRAVRPP